MRYTFADCVLDTERCELHRRGRPIKIRRQVLQVLIYLIERADRVVSKQELFEKLWAGRVVGDATLNSCIKEARQAVGDSGKAQRVLRTLHGQGYRFAANIEKADDSARVFPDTPKQPGSGLCAGTSSDQREFKQVTFLACRLGQARERATRIGPEAMDELMRGFFTTTQEVIESHRGTVTEWLGDGFTAIFGAPCALEDHARCGVLSALEIRRRYLANSENPVTGEHRPSLQFGLHSDSVLTGALGEATQVYTAVSDATQLARDICDSATDAVHVSESCYRRIETEVAAEQCEDTVSSVPVYRVHRVAVRRAGVPYRAMRRPSEFVGRDEELAILHRRLDLSTAGNGQTVCIVGEPGIGKSRLLFEFRESLSAHRVKVIQARCLPYAQSTPYFPLAALVRDECGITESDSIDDIRSKLDQAAARAGIREIDLLLELLNTGAELQSGSAFDAQDRRDRMFSLANELLLQWSSDRTSILLIEDLHWIDASSDEWLNAFVARVAAVPVQLVLTCRHGYQQSFLAHSGVTQIALPRLNDGDSERVVDSISSDLARPDEVRRQIIGRAQGNPFFLEELTWNLAHSESTGDHSLPANIHAVLAARIDRLKAQDKRMLQCAAVIGTPVDQELLRLVSAIETETLNSSLGRLEDSEFLYQGTSAVGRRAYHFRHALTRDVAYESLTDTTRRDLHHRIAKAYEKGFSKVATNLPELLAHHFTEAGMFGDAVECWFRAGQRAVRRSANAEAVAHFEKAMETSERLESGQQREQRQIAVSLAAGPSKMVSLGYSSPAVKAMYEHTLALCIKAGTDEQRFTAWWGLWLTQGHRGRIEEAGALSRQLLDFADQQDDLGLRLQAHHAGWTTEMWYGDLVACSEHALKGIELYDPAIHHEQAHSFGGHDPGVCAHGMAAIAAWFLGYPDQALERARNGARLARSLAHHHTALISLHDFVDLHALRGEPVATGHYARQLLDLTQGRKHPYHHAVAKVHLGWSEIMTGDWRAGMATLSEGLDGYRKIAATRNLALHLLYKAGAFAMRDRIEEGMAVVEEAQHLLAETGEVRWQPEVLRIKGELLRLQGAETAERCFCDGLELASEQSSRSLELRAATSLGSLWIDTGRTSEAGDLLEPLYAWFTEGLTTADLTRARDLLDRIGR